MLLQVKRDDGIFFIFVIQSFNYAKLAMPYMLNFIKKVSGHTFSTLAIDQIIIATSIIDILHRILH